MLAPGVANDLVAMGLVESSKAPSLSRSHAYAVIEPSGSLAVAVNVVVWPLSGDSGETVNEACGALLATEIDLVATVEAP